MIRIAVYDNSVENRKNLKQAIIKYTAQRNFDLDVYWFYDDISERKIKEYAPTINIAFISADLDLDENISQIIYKCNEDCRIIYYSAEKTDLEPMLKVRTRGFYITNSGESVIMQFLDEVTEELKQSDRHFYYETRRNITLYSFNSIFYFQSDKKYVVLHLKNCDNERVYSKLSDIETRLNSDFLRIHKSYILNSHYISRIDKSNKTVILKNGEVLPISDVNYKAVINYFSERDGEYE